MKVYACVTHTPLMTYPGLDFCDHPLVYRILGSHSCGYEEYYLLGYNGM
jgi:hypothetical protein